MRTIVFKKLHNNRRNYDNGRIAQDKTDTCFKDVLVNNMRLSSVVVVLITHSVLIEISNAVTVFSNITRYNSVGRRDVIRRVIVLSNCTQITIILEFGAHCAIYMGVIIITSIPFTIHNNYVWLEIVIKSYLCRFHQMSSHGVCWV